MFKWQAISLISRIFAMLLGVLQSVVIVNVLPTDSWGLIKVIASIGSIIGVSQAFGLTSGSTREISGAKDNKEAFKVFVTSLIFRLLISLPFALFLFFAAPYLSKGEEHRDLLIWALRLISFVLLIQATQGIFNSVLAGFRRFKVLFTYQVVIAVVSVSLFIPLVYAFDFKGYYYAYVLFNLIGAIVLSILAFKNFEKPYPTVTFADSKRILKEIFGISLAVYAVKILHTFWLESPILYLQYIEDSLFLVPIFAFALLYSTKLMVISDALTDVTLPVMSKKFIENIHDFKKSYKENYIKTFVILTFVSAFALYFSEEVITLVIKSEYFESINLIPFTILGIWSYSNINLFKSSIFVPAKKLSYLVISYLFMIISVYISFFITHQVITGTLLSLSIGFGLGSFFAYILSLMLIKHSLNFNLISLNEIYFFGISILFTSTFYFSDLPSKILFSLVYTIISFYFFKKTGVLELLLKNLVK